MMVASSCAASSLSSAGSQSPARTRGTCLDSLSRSISQSGCGYEPTSDVGSSITRSPSSNMAGALAGAGHPTAAMVLLLRLLERIDDLAGLVLVRRQDRLGVHALELVQGAALDAVILHLHHPGLGPFAVGAVFDVAHDGLHGVLAQEGGDVVVLDALGALDAPLQHLEIGIAPG